MNATRAFVAAGLVTMIATFAVGCDSQPPRPIDRSGGGAADRKPRSGGSDAEAPPKPKKKKDDRGEFDDRSEPDDSSGSGAAPSRGRPAEDFPQDVQQRFQKLVRLIDEAKKLKDAFHANPNEQTHAAADGKIAEAMQVGYDWPDDAQDFPKFQEYMAELAQLNSDLKEFEPK